VVGEVLKRLNEWDYETVVTLLRRHEYEPSRFDYKEVLNATGRGRDDAVRSLRCTVCAMANTDGGYILFGIRDRQHPVASLEDRIVGIPLADDLGKHFGDKVQDIQPEVAVELIPRAISLPGAPKMGIFVVHVPASPRRPHMVGSEHRFYRRSEGGTNQLMDFYEVRDQMLYTEERLRKARLFRLQLAQFRSQAQDALRHDQHGIGKYQHRFDVGSYLPLLADIAGLLPASDTTLERLLAVPVVARTFNRLMDLPRDQLVAQFSGGQGSPGIHWAMSLMTHVNRLDQLCDECERELSQVLGPLDA
jgi:hypothetical protein